ncbi:Fig1p Ecym_4503 [Eremothecium cymbalariae DBVPG|uniref:Factor-induced gene 1 protein n=1 Tax=Eremothecium cymbalariae (strain CBS 270.75 / DBVPG 7215 / KCTC 17166 / NRRL Y-17582) TaxID=931890 RepID=G8JU37_ERECY|nr:hypothetical protein Ecym_4503 [Eremothecium cymbalariae DBVPG\
MFGMAWFIIKRMPRILALMLNFISIFLMVFLLIGCYNEEQQTTFLTRFQFNKESPMYSIIENTFKGKTETEGLENIRVKAGYLGICVSNLPQAYSRDPVLCFGRKNVTASPLYEHLNIKIFNIPSRENATQPDTTNLNILDLAHLSIADVIHPYILMLNVILCILMFFLTLYTAVPKLPFKRALNSALLIISPILVVLLSFGSMWSHVAISASKAFIPKASMNIIKIHKGRKSSSMVWFSFIFILLNCIIIWAIYFRDRKSPEEETSEQREYNKYSNSEYGRYNGDRSTTSTKY